MPVLQFVGHPPDGDEPPTDSGTGRDLRGYPMTDSGNAERILALFGQDIRFCKQMEKFLLWDGKRWAIDEIGAVSQKAKQVARLLHAQATGYSQQMEKWARTSESQACIAATLKRLATEDGSAVIGGRAGSASVPPELSQRRCGSAHRWICCRTIAAI